MGGWVETHGHASLPIPIPIPICTIRIRTYLNQPDMQVWQSNYHDSIKRTPRKVHTARYYIINNPHNAPPTPPHLIYNIPC